MGDYHVHLHQHGRYGGVGPLPGEYPDGLVESYIETAAQRGVTEVGFTEHLYRCTESADVLGRFWEREKLADLAAQTAAFVAEDRTLSLERYVEVIQRAKDDGLPVKLGLEVDFFPETIEAVLDFIDDYPWDFLIGSVHWIGGWAMDHEDAAYEYERRGVHKSYEQYFDLAAQLAASSAVDALAHIDVIKKFGHVLSVPPTEMYEPVVRAAATSGTAVEVSSAGLYKRVNEPYPERQFLEMFHAAGVPITLASDAHVFGECARDNDEMIRYARSVGYTERVVFDKRVKSTVPLRVVGER
jgi:histidinol-phosphatase (PHP family)